MTIFLYTLFIIQSSAAQSILLSLSSNDCPKCQIILSSFLEKTKNVPVFYIFPSIFKQDSTELVQQYVGSEHSNNVIFSDYYFKQINAHSSNISFLSSTGKIIFQQSIMGINPSDTAIIDSLYNADVILKTHRPLLETYKNGWKINKNFTTSTVTIDSGGQMYKLKADSVTVDKCIQANNKANPGFYQLTINEIKNKNIPEVMLHPKLDAFFLHNGTSYYTVNIPYAVPPNEEEKKVGLKGALANFTTMIRFNPGKESDFFPIEFPEHLPNKQSRYIQGHSFIVVNDSTFLFSQYPTEWKKYPQERSYISVFKLKDKKLVFDSQLENRYPDIYFTSGIGYTLMPSFNIFDYPYYIPLIGTQISNLASGKDFDFTPPYEIDYSSMNSINFMRDLSQGKTKPPVENVYICQNNEKDKLYLISIANDIYYLNVFDIPKMKLLKTVNLNDKRISIHDYAFFDFDKNKNSFLIEDKEGVIRSLPLAFLIGADN